MGDTQHTIGPALTAALRLLGRHPKVRAEARDGSPEAEALLLALRRHPSVRAYLGHRPYRDVVSRVAMDHLLDLAEDWLLDGQQRAIAVLYEQRIADGTIDSLMLASDRLVHWAVFALAYRDGPRVCAAERYVEVLIATEFGHGPSRETIRRSYRRLEARGLVELALGRRGTERMRSTIVSVAPFISASSIVPAIDTVATLTLSERTMWALMEYQLNPSRPKPKDLPSVPRRRPGV